ncbi:MAG: hypothetical protein AAFO79_01195 [Pseudomonadota bacterium]
MTKRTQNVSFTTSPDMRDVLQAVARYEDRSASSYIERTLRQHIVDRVKQEPELARRLQEDFAVPIEWIERVLSQ